MRVAVSGAAGSELTLEAGTAKSTDMGGAVNIRGGPSSQGAGGDLGLVSGSGGCRIRQQQRCRVHGFCRGIRRSEWTRVCGNWRSRHAGLWIIGFKHWVKCRGYCGRRHAQCSGDTSSVGAGSAVSISAGRSEALGGSVLVAAETGDVDEGDVILPAGSGEAGACDRIALLDGRARDESQWTAKVAWTHRVLQGNA